MRLCVHYPESIKDGTESFVEPSVSADQWKDYLDRALPEWGGQYQPRWFMITKIAHLLQHIEFSAALILHHLDSLGNRTGSSLHATLQRTLSLQFSVIACSILEGLGTYYFHFNEKDNSEDIWSKRVYRDNWINSLATRIEPTDLEKRANKAEAIKKIVALRDETHFDTIGDRSLFYLFNIDRSFKPALKTLYSVLETLNPDFPRSGTVFQNTLIKEGLPTLSGDNISETIIWSDLLKNIDTE